MQRRKKKKFLSNNERNLKDIHLFEIKQISKNTCVAQNIIRLLKTLFAVEKYR